MQQNDITRSARPWLSDNDIAERRGQSRPHIWRLVKQGDLPKPVKLSAGCTRWPAHEIEAIDRARLAGANDADIRKLIADMYAARRQAVAA